MLNYSTMQPVDGKASTGSTTARRMQDTSGNQYIIKTALLTSPLTKEERDTFQFAQAQFRATKDEKEKIAQQEERRYFVNSYVANGIVQALLGDATDTITLCTNSTNGSISYGSKYFENAKNLDEIQKRANIAGKERAFLTRSLVGDVDQLADNYLDVEGQCVLIDLGRAFHSFEKDPKSFITAFAERVAEGCDPNEDIANQDKIKFKLSDLKVAAESLYLSDEKIREIVAQRVNELAKAGINFSDIDFMENEKRINFKTPEEYATHVSKNIIAQRDIIKNLAPLLVAPSSSPQPENKKRKAPNEEQAISPTLIKKVVCENIQSQGKQNTR